jgi:diguanylate cyclase (GGDEF)-like protein
LAEFVEVRKQRALELLVMISEDFIRVSFESINYQLLIDYVMQLSDADYAILNLVDETDDNLQKTVAVSLDQQARTNLSATLGLNDIIGSRWRIRNNDLQWEYTAEDYSFKLPGKPVQPLIRVFKSFRNVISNEEADENVINALDRFYNIEETVIVRLMDDSRLIGNFVLLFKKNKKFDQHFAVRIYARQLSQLLIRRSREKEINRLLNENNIIFNSTQDILALVRKIGQGDYEYVRVNDAFTSQTGLDTSDIIGLSPTRAFSQSIAEEMIAHYNDCLLAQVPVSFEMELDLPNGNKVFQFTLTPVHFDKGDYIVSSAKDITDERSNQERVEYLSFHDQLTGLYNRHYFNHSLRRLDNQRNLPLSIIMIDVNGLKLVNDAFGHNLGDQLLHAAGQTISEHSRADDIVCRIGGDEFVFILPQTDEAGTETVVNRLRKACRDVRLGPFQLSFSLGWATRNSLDMSTRDLLQQAEEWMYKHKLIESPAMRMAVIETITEIMNNMPYEADHAHLTAEMAAEMAGSLGWSDRRVQKIARACRYHDIGKITVPVEILNKRDALDDREIALIRRHSEAGYRILASAGEYADLADIVLSHHERWDGGGYPRGLAAENIPVNSRVIAIVDAYDAMTSDRPWRAAKTVEQALAELRSCAGTQFDPKLVDLFISKEIYRIKK